MNALLDELSENGKLAPRLNRDNIFDLIGKIPLQELMAKASFLRDCEHGGIVTYSRKVFIPLTHLCRDVCHYCTFAEVPRENKPVYMTREQVLAVAKAGMKAGCKEVLFTLGDKPELRYSTARDALESLGHQSTISYLAEVSELVFEETGLMPHLNPGVISRADIQALRQVSVSQGLMLESASLRLCERGGPHFGSPDKRPEVRLETLRLAGEESVPMTTGILIGIGETRKERLQTLLEIREIAEAYGHIQEVIIQNFRAKPNTKMANFMEPLPEELLWTVAVARIIFGGKINIQAPPNLSPEMTSQLIDAGINDWGGVSPVTPDFVNPEAPWPHLDQLEQQTRAGGKELVERLSIYPEFAVDFEHWLSPKFHCAVIRGTEASGLARIDPWAPGTIIEPRLICSATGSRIGQDLKDILAKCLEGGGLTEKEVVRLFSVRGSELEAVTASADTLRSLSVGDSVTYAINRNINYTNVCSFRCQFCAFSKGKLSESLRGKPYVVDLKEISRRTLEAWERGATEVCMQGGIHPGYNGETYIEICKAAKQAAPNIHIHAFTPLEISQGARSLGLPISRFLEHLIDAGLSSLPGTAAEILDDEVRAIICPDKVNTKEWLEVMRIAHGLGLRSTATIMFGHVEKPVHWARHLFRVRELQIETGGFTEFVPLPFVHMEAPIYLKGRSRKGPTFREAVLMHAISRLVLYPHLLNIQVSWVKMGPSGTRVCLQSGVNDLGGTLMNESISRAAGAMHGQEMTPQKMVALIEDLGRKPVQRSTLYTDVSQERISASFSNIKLAEPQFIPAKAFQR